MEVVPEPADVAEQISEKEGVVYTSGSKTYYSSGNISRAVHLQVSPDVVDEVKELLCECGYSPARKPGTTESGTVIVEGNI
jgi:hypothetical protein